VQNQVGSLVSQQAVTSVYFSSRKHLAVEVEQGTERYTNISSEQEQPPWRDHLNNIKIMRQSKDAPVDSMGCGTICDKTATLPVGQSYVD